MYMPTKVIALTGKRCIGYEMRVSFLDVHYLLKKYIFFSDKNCERHGAEAHVDLYVKSTINALFQIQI